MANKQERKFSVNERIRSFSYALNGLKILLREEHNARIHLMIAIGVIIAGIFFRLSIIEWIVVCLFIGFVFAMEIINSAIENLCDIICPEQDERIKKIKDLAASGVLIAAMISIVAGFVLFIPKIVQLLN